MFKPVTPQVDFPKLEEEILQYWKKNKIFEKSLAKDTPKGNWTFLDGPPFITGLPHYGSLLSSIPKDLFPRYKTMQGYRVRRVWGWDCHGLPAENKVEQELGIKRKRDIEEKIGIKKFIESCKLYVKNVSSEWQWYVNHVGRWVDFENAYKTMDLSYMETVMWVFKQMYDKGFIYKGLRVLLYCPHCATPISNFEVAMDADNFKDLSDPSTIYKYQLAGKPKTYLLAWSTTPWNKIVTPALAVNPKLTYAKVKLGQENYILAKTTLKILGNEKYQVVEEFGGEKLVGQKFVPHYDYYKIDKGKKAFIVVGGDFVTAEEGTGIVTLAVYGEEDLAVMQKENIHIEVHLNEEGIVKSEVPKFGGLYYLKANEAVNEDLKERRLIYREEDYIHTVPTCWRCGTRLYYAPQNAWYVAVQKLKVQMEKTNEFINWFPEHFKHGRFLKSLQSAPDWNISRNRYFGSPVPVWECMCGERFVPGSIKELEERADQKITDLHKPQIDEITITCKNCSKKVKRVPEVLDSWIEAGSASFAERHFPFEKKIRLSEFFPPDFIVEYTGQIRAWFYVLHVIAAALLDSHAFKNVIVTGVILGTDGRKMSKNYGNYPDPREMLGKYGGDALRLYLMGSPVMKGEDILISEEQYRNQVRGLLLILWNVYNFFVVNANADKWIPPSNNQKFKPIHVLDQWILSRLHGNVSNVTKALERFDTVDAIGHAGILFIHDLSNWYVRRIRDRVGPSAPNSQDKKDAYQTLWLVLSEYCKVLAPIIPFVTEEIYKNLTGEESVHLASWPALNKSLRDVKLEKDMNNGINLASVIHSFRKTATLKVRIPLQTLTYEGPQQLSDEARKVVEDEVNVYKLIYQGKSKEYTVTGDTSEKNQDLVAGEAREIIRQIQQERKKLGTRLDEKVDVFLPDWPEDFTEVIKSQALVKNIAKGNEFFVKRL